jgi:hypothetical protein
MTDQFADRDELIDDRFHGSAIRGDIDGIMSCYTHDIAHWRMGRDAPLIGLGPVREVYERQTYRPIRIETLSRHHGPDHTINECRVELRIDGEMFGRAGRGRHVVARVLHFLIFRDGLIARDSAWVDRQSIINQLDGIGERSAKEDET